MTILNGSKRKVTSYSEFVEAFDVSPQEILNAKGAGYRADILESAQERSDDAGPDAIEYIPDEFLQDLLAQDTLEDIIGPVLTARDQDYVYLREYGVHTIISMDGAASSVTIGDEHPITGDQANSDPVLVADFSELPNEVLHYVDDQLADRLATDGSEVMAEARALGHVEIEPPHVEFHDFPVRSLVHAVAREKVADIEREVLAGDRDDYTEAELERFYRVLDRELSDTA